MIKRCHEELLERITKRTTILESEVGVLTVKMSCFCMMLKQINIFSIELMFVFYVQVQSIIRQLLEGIAYLHHNDIIHLDIKVNR